jgi:zinc protease
MAIFGAMVKPGDSLERARDRLIEVVESTFAAAAPTADEVKRVQRDYETGNERELDDPQEFGVSLSESIAAGDWRIFFEQRNEMAELDPARPGALAQQFFRRDNRSVALFIPEDNPHRVEVPPPLSPAELMKEFHPRVAGAQGEAFDPSQANIDARTKRVKQGNLELALLAKKTRGQTVNVAMGFQFGDEKSLQGKSLFAELTAAMLERGTPTLTRQQIADEKLRLKITGSLLSFQTTRANLDESLRFSARVLREANFPVSEVEQLRSELLTGLQAGLSDPSQLSNDALRSHLDTYPLGDPRHYLTLAERIEGVKAMRREDLVAYHHDFWGTARGQVAVVGDFDTEATEKALFEAFSSWVSPAAYARVTREPRPVPAVRILVPTPDKENAVYRARVVLSLRDDEPDAVALMMADEILGGGSFMHNRLVDRIRQKEGLSYGVGSGLAISSEDHASTWGFGAISAPQNAARVEALVREEAARMLRDGFTKAEFDDARNGLLQRRMQARTEDGSLAGGWVHLLDHGRTFAFSRKQEDGIRALTPEGTIEVARRYLDLDKLTVVIAGDPAKGAK